jgi:methylthioribose-1-phosphate isomerase
MAYPVVGAVEEVWEGESMINEHPQHGLRTVWWEESAHGSVVCMIDQTALPQELVTLRLTDEEQVAEAIRTLKVRGAPAIGVAAAFGIALAFHRLLEKQGASEERAITPQQAQELQERLRAVSDLLASTRPTAVNLFWAIERMQQRAGTALSGGCSLVQLAQCLRDEAQTIAEEDFEACKQMGIYGAQLIADGASLLTHCNAGALATAGWGTALAPMYAAHKAGKAIHVFVDETRPILQGARLTAWELQQEGIPLTLITDNMAAHFMRRGEINAVFVGADRIAANGDFANKIGTYGVAVLARAHSIPFYVVAPLSTIDLTLPSGEQIPIEQRNPSEVTAIRGMPVAPAGVRVANPAFDVTPHGYVTAIITERGIARPPYDLALRALFSSHQHIGKQANV